MVCRCRDLSWAFIHRSLEVQNQTLPKRRAYCCLLLSLSVPMDSLPDCRTQVSYLARVWAGVKRREGRRRNQTWRTGGKTGTACDVQPTAWSGAGDDQACQGHWGETGLKVWKRWMGRGGKQEWVRERPIERRELKRVKNSQITGRKHVTENLACSKSSRVSPFPSRQQNPLPIRKKHLTSHSAPGLRGTAASHRCQLKGHFPAFVSAVFSCWVLNTLCQ